MSLHFCVRIAMALDNEDTTLLVAALLLLSRMYGLTDLPSPDVKRSFACSLQRGALLPILFRGIRLLQFDSITLQSAVVASP